MFGELLRRRELVPEILERSDWPRFRFDGINYQSPFAGYSSLNALEASRNAVVSAAVQFRSQVFSEITFKFQRFEDSRPAGLFGDARLRILESPWPGCSTGDLLSIMETDVSVFGNSYWVREGQRLCRLPADRVLVVTGEKTNRTNNDRYAYELLGYLALPHPQLQPDIDTPIDPSLHGTFYTPEQVAHYKALPDPANPFVGRSWISTILPDSLADNELTGYKSMYIRNAATPNMAVMFPKEYQPEEIERFKELMDAKHAGMDKAFKTLYLGGGADVRMLGSNFEQLDMHRTQGGGETRIAVASGVPATILGISEGLGGSALNAGNYMASRRRFADGTMRPLWRAACSALSQLLLIPSGTRLWYDERDVSFLQEDVRDTAEIRMREAGTIRQLIDGGFDPSSVVDAVVSGDMARLIHTGNLSVQLRPVNESGTVDASPEEG
jgi:phage portal protein BeeE